MIYYGLLHELGPKSSKLKAEAIAPAPGLQNLIDHYIVLTGHLPIQSNDQWYLLPDNRAYFIFYLFDCKNTIVPKWSIVGPRSKHRIISRQDRAFTFICSLKPGALNWLIDVPVSELTDTSVDASYLLKANSSDSFEKLTINALKHDILSFVKDFESLIASSLTTPSETNCVAQAFYQSCLNGNVVPLLTTVSKTIGYSDRQLRTIVRNYIGQSPKMVAQIERFTKSLVLIKDGESWTNIAYSAGYYDQSHMISDYTKFLGSTPNKLFS